MFRARGAQAIKARGIPPETKIGRLQHSSTLIPHRFMV